MSEAKTCPMEGVMEVDFNSEPFLTDYKKIFAGIHASGCPYAHSTVGDHYAVASHAEIIDILKKYDTWKSKYGPGLDYLEAPGVLVSVDPPEHTFEVKIVASSFSIPYFNSLAPQMERFVNGTIDTFYADGRVDLHNALSIPFPLFVIFTMLGIPQADEQGDRTPWVREWIIESVGQMLKPQAQRVEEMASGANARAIELTMKTLQMFEAHLADCKGKLETDEYQGDTNVVCRFLTTPGPDGTYLTDDKILGFMSFLLTAGSATTTIMLSNLIHRLLTEPEEFEKLKADHDLIPLAVEEAVRLDAPVQGLYRTNDQEVDLGPWHLEKDTKVMLLWAAGNLDPNVYDEPLKFSLDRDLKHVRRNLSFGYGTHFCRGAPLARLEGEIFLKAILERLPNLRLDGEVVPEKRMPVLQGIRELPIAWDLR